MSTSSQIEAYQRIGGQIDEQRATIDRLIAAWKEDRDNGPLTIAAIELLLYHDQMILAFMDASTRCGILYDATHVQAVLGSVEQRARAYIGPMHNETEWAARGTNLALHARALLEQIDDLRISQELG